MIWITSDTHYWHKNICLGSSVWQDKSECRDFNSPSEMSAGREPGSGLHSYPVNSRTGLVFNNRILTRETICFNLFKKKKL